jgi:hypothetical protein
LVWGGKRLNIKHHFPPPPIHRHHPTQWFDGILVSSRQTKQPIFTQCLSANFGEYEFGVNTKTARNGEKRNREKQLAKK